MQAANAAIKVKYGPKVYELARTDTVLSLKHELVKLTGLTHGEIKLLLKGKVAKDDESIPAIATAMMVRQPRSEPELLVRFREIVSGRVAQPVILDPATTTHDELVEVAVKALHLPPCDDQTEVRLYLPHTGGALMRTDLKLTDYALPSGDDVLSVYCVPCPLGLQRSSAAAAAQVEAQATAEAHAVAIRAEAEAVLGAETPASAPSSNGSIDALAEQASAAILSSTDSESLRAVLEQLGVTPMMLPPSLADAADEETAVTDDGTPAYFVASSSSAASAASAKEPAEAIEAAKEASPPPSSSAASLIPTRLRTGLMPAIDDAPTAVEIPPAVLAAEMAAYEASFTPPTAEEWALMADAEETLLEERCIELVASLAPRLSPARRMSQLPSLGSPRVPRAVASATPRTSRSHGPAGRVGKRRPLSADAETLDSSVSSLASSAPAMSDDDDNSDESDTDGAADDGAATDAVAADLAMRCMPVSPSTPRPGKVKGIACRECGVRLPLTACASACRCGFEFCARHMHSHRCGVDYKGTAQRKLREDNPAIEGSTLERL